MTADTASAPQQRKSESIRFVCDEQGRTLFYPDGWGRSGYVVDTVARERALRDAAERYDARLRKFAWLFLLPVFALLEWLFRFGLPLALAGAAGIFVAVHFIEPVFTNIAFGRLAAGMERVAPRNRRRVWLPAAIAAGLAAAAWLILELYDLRLVGLPHDGAIAVFYPTISKALLCIFLGAGLLLITLWLPAGRLTEARHFFLFVLRLVLAALFAGVGLAAILPAFFAPKPALTVARFSFSCGWNTAWSDIAQISLKTKSGRFGGAWVELTPNPGSGTAVWLAQIGRQGPLTCKIDGLNVDYPTVYQAIRDAWTADPTRGRPQGRSR